jgi:hypothetical protein
MRLVRVAILLILAAFLAAEPVVHTHPLIPHPGGSDTNGITTPNVCAVCAVGADRIVLDAPALVAPLIVVDHLVTVSRRATSADAQVPSSSRAPPAV